MRGYERDEYDDYEEDERYDDYEEEDEEEYEEVKEERKPTREEIQYLELRQKLKEGFRKKINNETGSSSNSKGKQKKRPSDSYGSFFGPSQPVISQRVIQETKSLLENQHLTSKLDSLSQNKKSSAPTTSGSKPVVHNRPPKVNEAQRQLQKRRETRDYSFLLSDDAELPAPSRNPPQRSLSTPKSDARPAQVPLKNKQPLSNGSHERRPVYSNGTSHSKAVSQKTSASQSNLKSIASGKQTGNNNGVGPSQLSRPKSLPPKTPSVPDRRPVELKPSAISDRRPSGSTDRRPSASTDRRPSGPTDRKPLGSTERRPSGSTDRRPLVSTERRPLGSADRRPSGSTERRPSESTGRRPLGSADRRPYGSTERGLSTSMDKRPSATLERRPSASGRNIPPPSHKPSSSKMQLSHPKQHLEPRKGLPDPNRAKSMSKQPMVSSKPQMSRPAKPISSHSRDDRPKKRPSRPFPEDDSDDDAEKALSMIRKMFNTKRYQDVSDDDSDMEVGFDQIMAEEKRSARIARKEDEEQLRLIEEEERRERMRKLKKQKLSH